MTYKLQLNEQWFDEETVEVPEQEMDSLTIEETSLEGPEMGEDLAVSSLLKELITDIYRFTDTLDVDRVNMESYPEIKNLLTELASESMSAIGKLQQALSIVSPNAENISNGTEEMKQNNDTDEDSIDLENQIYKVEYLDADKKFVETFYKANQIGAVIKHLTESLHPYLILGVNQTDFNNLSADEKKNLFESVMEL